MANAMISTVHNKHHGTKTVMDLQGVGDAVGQG